MNRPLLHDYQVQVSYWLVYKTVIKITAETEEAALELARDHSQHLDPHEWDCILDWKDAILDDSDTN